MTICNDCDTVRHCMKAGCIPKVPAPTAQRASWVLMKIEHDKPIPDLTDIAAGRVYCLDRVDDVTASLIDERDALQLQATLDLWMEGRARRG